VKTALVQLEFLDRHVRRRPSAAIPVFAGRDFCRYAPKMDLTFKVLAVLVFSLLPLSAAVATNVSVTELSHGRLQIGLVTVDPKSKTLVFPGVVNMRTGLVEYAVVTASGKVHESIFKTDAEPFHIHTAMLLLGAKLDTNVETAVFFDAKRQIPGPKLKIEVVLPGPNGRTNLLDRFVQNAQDKAPSGNQIPFWIYNGSRTSDGVFLAQREGSIVSLIADPAALTNNPRQDRENDELWSANTPEIPEIDSAVEVRFSFFEGKR
jgi:hypothetical protein